MLKVGYQLESKFGSEGRDVKHEEREISLCGS